MRISFALLLMLVLGGCGSESTSNDVAAPPVTVTVTETATETAPPPTEPEPEPGRGCSTSTIRTTLPEQELPQPVAEVRRAVWGAAIACDYEELERLALERGEGFTFSYGGGTSAAEHWRTLEESGNETPMRDLAAILSLPYTRNESGSYAWPTAYSEAPTDEAWQALVDAGLHTQAEVDAMRAGGSGYLGYRTAITADGDWQFFVAGD